MEITVSKEGKIKVLDLLSSELKKEAEKVKGGEIIGEEFDIFEDDVFNDCDTLDEIIERGIAIQKAIEGKSEEEVEKFIEKMGYLMGYELMDFDEALENVKDVEVIYTTLRELAENRIREKLKDEDDFNCFYSWIDWDRVEESLEDDGYRQYQDYVFYCPNNIKY